MTFASSTPDPVPATETPAATFTPSPAPTPKGGGPLIAFVSNRGDGRTFQVLTMRPDGSEWTQVTFTEGNKSDPTWSPDGKKLLYVANGGRDNYGNDLGLDIWAMDADGSNHVNLTQSPEDDYDPAWSPNGEQIVFTSTRVEAVPGMPQLFIMNADGSAPNWITRGNGAEFSPTWSPDGEWIAFAISIQSAPPVLFLRTGEGADQRAFDFNLGKRVGEINDPAWSPDGLTIAYTCVKPGQNEICLVVVATNGTEIFTLTSTLGNKEPAWSPDGHWIIFTSTRDQNSEIYIMDSLGRNQVNISNHDSIDRDPTWQPQPNP
jgi:TolB protein